MDADRHKEKRLVEDATAIYRAGLRAVQADRLLREVDWRSWAPREMRAYDRVQVVGMGKATMALAGEVEAQLGDRLGRGVVVVPDGHPATFPDDLERPRRIAVLTSSHPVPDARSVAAADRLLDEVRSCTPKDLLLVLISGGGSSLCAGFAGEITLDDALETYRLLLESGVDIHAMNTVRKHLTTIGGGRLAAAAGRSDVLALVVSDVVGDDLSVIASGPTVPDATTAAEAVDVLRRCGIWEIVPDRVRTHLMAVEDDNALETPDAESNVFERVHTKLLGTNRRALDAAAREADSRGYRTTIRSHELIGEAREVGARLARETTAAAESVSTRGSGRCLLWGGETTVTVKGAGTGGRNQELALSAAVALEGARGPLLLLSAGTDGRDGPTPAAGAYATVNVAARARRKGLEPEAYLHRNDSYRFWKEMGGLVTTGPTHTNVMDLQVGLVHHGDRTLT